MAVRRLAKDQPDDFQFTEETMRLVEERIAKYPPERKMSAVIPVLWLAQKQNDGWTSEPLIRRVAELLDMPNIRVYEVATFYTMFNLEPVGENLVQVCTTTPCWLRGSDDVVKACKKHIHENPHTISEDGKFSWMEVECLGACVNAPMLQINDDYYEDLDEASTAELIAKFRKGEKPTPGSVTGRTSSEPVGELTSLTDPALYANEPKRGDA